MVQVLVVLFPSLTVLQVQDGVAENVPAAIVSVQVPVPAATELTQEPDCEVIEAQPDGSVARSMRSNWADPLVTRLRLAGFGAAALGALAHVPAVASVA